MGSPNIHPLRDNVVIKRVEAEDVSAGGIVLPDAAKEKPKEGIVVAVGRGIVVDEGRLVEPQVKVGDRVLFGGWGGNEVQLGDDEHLILKEHEILAIIE